MIRFETIALVLVLVGCSATELRLTHSEWRVSPTARQYMTSVADVAATSAVAPKPAPTSAVAPDPVHRDALDTAFLASFGITSDPALWAAATSPDWTTPAALDESSARTVFLARNQDLRAAWRRWRARTHRHGQALHLRRLIEQVDGFARRPDSRPAEFPLPGPHALQGEVVRQDIALAGQQFRMTALRLVERFTVAFHDARLHERESAVLSQYVKLSRRFVDVVRTRYASGQSRKADLLRAEMRLAEMTDRLASAREARSAAGARLGALLGSTRSVRAGTPDRVRRTPSLKQVRNAAADSPAVMLPALRWARSVATLQLVERRILPDLANDSSERAGSAPRRFPMPYVSGSGFADELRDRIAGNADELAQARVQVPAEAERLWTRLRDSVRRQRLFRRTNVPKATQALDAADSEYRVGRTTYLNLDDVQQLWLRVSLDAIRARRDAAVTAAALRRLLGHWPSSITPSQTEITPLED